MAKANPQRVWRGVWQKRQRQTKRGRGRSTGGGGWRKSLGRFEQLELRTLLSSGIIELGPSDNVALDQPRVARGLLASLGGIRGQFGSVCPNFFNSFLFDTGATSILVMQSAASDMAASLMEPGTAYAFTTQGGRVVFLPESLASQEVGMLA
jgi:hypothetical protein